MPKIRIPMPGDPVHDLIDNLETVVGPRHTSRAGRGWRFVSKMNSDGPGKFVFKDRPGPGGILYYVLEIDDPVLATYFKLRYA